LVESDDWDGPSFQTCKNSAWICESFEKSRHRDVVSFSIHAECASLPPDEADTILDWCEQTLAETGRLPTIKATRERAKEAKEALAHGCNTSPLVSGVLVEPEDDLSPTLAKVENLQQPQTLVDEIIADEDTPLTDEDRKLLEKVAKKENTIIRQMIKDTVSVKFSNARYQRDHDRGIEPEAAKAERLGRDLHKQLEAFFFRFLNVDCTLNNLFPDPIQEEQALRHSKYIYQTLLRNFEFRRKHHQTD
jgi:hypothetical protein